MWKFINHNLFYTNNNRARGLIGKGARLIIWTCGFEPRRAAKHFILSRPFLLLIFQKTILILFSDKWQVARWQVTDRQRWPERQTDRQGQRQRPVGDKERERHKTENDTTTTPPDYSLIKIPVSRWQWHCVTPSCSRRARGLLWCKWW